MSVLIKGMEMPKHCGECGIEWCDRWKRLIIAGMSIAKTRPEDCPLIEVPPHGRLIDADAFIKSECNSCDGACESMPCDCLICDRDYRCDFMKDIANAPTVIEAEEGE